MASGVITPSYRSGFYSPKRGGLAKYPRIWRGCVGRWSPCLGPTAARLFDHSIMSGHAELTGTSYATSWVLQGGYYGIDFDASDDMATTGATVLKSLNEFSVMAWVHSDGIGEGSTGRIVTKNDLNPFGVFCRNTNNGLSLAVNNSVIVTATITGASGNFSGYLWCIVATYRNGGNAVIYANGRNMAEAGVSAALASNSNPVVIGNNAAGTRTFDGRIFDVGLWSHQLTQADANQLYEGGPGYGYQLDRARSLKTTAAAFKAYWARQQSYIIGGGVS